MKALVFGSLNIDYVYEVNHFVQPGETLASNNLQLFSGGKGLNQSIALSRSGVETWHAGAVGLHDSDRLFQSLKEAYVHTELIQKKDISSGHAIIQKTPEGENSIILYGGANQMITKEEVDTVLSHFKKGDFLVLQNEINQMPYIIEKAYQLGMTIVFNPSPINQEIDKMPLQYVHYLVLNEIEGAAMSKSSKGDSKEILNQLIERFPNMQIVLTIGKDGSLYGYKDKRYVQPIYKAKVVDTTAAGDTFTGFFIGSVIKGKEIKEALQIASKAAALAVSQKGASTSIPTLKEVENLS